MPGNNKISRNRTYIDRIDEKVLALLNRRAELSLKIRKVKQDCGDALYDPKREEEVVDNLCKKNKGPLYDENVRELFKQIMKINRELPDEK